MSPLRLLSLLLCVYIVLFTPETAVGRKIIKGHPSVLDADPQIGTNFLYNSGSFSPPSNCKGIFGEVLVTRPHLSSEDFHTLAEITAELDGQQIVEIGCTVDWVLSPAYADSSSSPPPALFVFHWINGP